MFVNQQRAIYQFLVGKKVIIVWGFWVVYTAFFAFLFYVGFETLFKKTIDPLAYYDLGRKFGQYAIFSLLLAILPGILGRFGIRIPITLTLTFFRRQLGILTFIFAFSHFYFISLLPSIALNMFPPQFVLFTTFGLLALTFLFLLFITSNNFSVIKLGPWWKRLHRSVYIVLWLILLHTAMQRWSIYAILIGIFAALEVASLLYIFWKKRSSVSSQTPQQ